MKKKILSATLIGVMLATAFLASCGAAPGDMGFGGADSAAFNLMREGGFNEEVAYAPAPEAAPAVMPAPDAPGIAYEMDASMADPGLGMPVMDDVMRGGDVTGIVPLPEQIAPNLAEKIIYSYYADIETLKFDETLAELEKLIAAYGAFIENSSVSGVNYDAIQRGWASYRYAYFSIRVPVQHLSAVTARLGSLGNVVNQSSNATNITAQFMDTESRLSSLRIQEERLLEMLKKAELVEDMIAIESSLADVRYQIESLTSMLTNWQRQVDYSTLTLSISEVEEYKEITPIHRSYWQRMGDGIISTLRGVGNFFMNLFMWLVVSAPVLIILAVIAAAVFFIARKQIRKAKAKRMALKEREDGQNPQ